MLENDLTSIDCRKSNLNKLTQFVPDPVRARVYELESLGMKCLQIIRYSKNIWCIEYETGYCIKRIDSVHCDGDLYDQMMLDQYQTETKSSLEAFGEAEPMPIIPN